MERVFDSAARSGLPRRLPPVPAAVPIFDGRGRTTLLVLDFDANIHGRAAVESDVATARQWLVECGARVVEDRSTSGGAHLLVPLHPGTPHSIRHVTPVLVLLANRLRTLDLSPMRNDRTGCITPPGSACREGGHRTLVGSLDDAVDAFMVRSEPGVIARLVALLGVLSPPEAKHRVVSAQAGSSTAAVLADNLRQVSVEHAGSDRMRVHPPVLSPSMPLPPVVAGFAVDGTRDVRWPSTHEARQSVLAQAAMRGYSLADVHTLAESSWPGFAAAYDRYGTQRGSALARDWSKACRYVAAIAPEVQSSGHRYGNTGGHDVLTGAAVELQREWLANATCWVDATWPRSPKRWTVLAVLQAVAYMAVLGGEIVNGTSVVAVGGRTLSTEAAMMPETTMWETLAEVRELPGSPILRTRRGAGLLPDAYALVTPRDQQGTPIVADTGRIGATRVEPVHLAWRALGLHTRRLYEVVTHQGVTRPEEAFAAARMGRSAGYEALAVLTTAGLITARRGHLSGGAVSLDDYATRRRLHELRADRLERHRLERALWRDWLDVRFAVPPPEDPAVDSRDVDLDTLPHGSDVTDEARWAHLLAADQLPDEPPAHNTTEAPQDDWDTDDAEAFWRQLAADPTPPPSDHAAAVELLTLELGASIVAMEH